MVLVIRNVPYEIRHAIACPIIMSYVVPCASGFNSLLSLGQPKLDRLEHRLDVFTELKRWILRGCGIDQKACFLAQVNHVAIEVDPLRALRAPAHCWERGFEPEGFLARPINLGQP